MESTRQKNPNPRRLFSLLHEGQDRIWDMKLANDDCIYLACGATYGKLSGGLVRFNPQTYDYRVFHDLMPEQTLWCLEARVPGKIIIGSWIYGGLGQKPSTTEGRLGIFDMATEKIERLIVPVPQAKNVTAITLWQTPNHNFIVGTADGALFVYDLVKNEIIFRDEHGWGDTASLCTSRDGWVYGLAQRAIYRFDPERHQFEKLDDFRCEGFVDKLIEDKDGNLYFSSMTELYRLER
ncbi:MAG: hypothetical protein ONB43_02265 [candidate division KSB1 bacterium]|nr:hypothetical protein [candidate division KSB1 bacterium]